MYLWTRLFANALGKIGVHFFVQRLDATFWVHLLSICETCLAKVKTLQEACNSIP